MAKSSLTCSVCGRRTSPEQIATCPSCKRRYCVRCGGVTDHIMNCRVGESDFIFSLVIRCPEDGVLLEKPGRDPYIESLRDLEGYDWRPRAIDPKGELAPVVSWSDEVVGLARRCLAIGMTFHPNPVMTFGVLGAALRTMQGEDGFDYLEECARSFGAELIPRDEAVWWVVSLADALNLSKNLPEQRQALIVARQFIRHQAGW